jgi:hypothetical protein
MVEKDSVPDRGRKFSLYYPIQSTFGAPVLGNKKYVQSLAGNVLERDCFEERDESGRIILKCCREIM